MCPGTVKDLRACKGWVGRRNSGHEPAPTAFEKGLRIKERLRRGESTTTSSHKTHVPDPGVGMLPPTLNCGSLDLLC